MLNKIVSALMVGLVNLANTIPAIQAYKRALKQVNDDDDSENLDDNSNDGLKGHDKHGQRTFLGSCSDTIPVKEDH